MDDDFPTPPKTIREYLSRFRDSGAVFQWIWNNVITSEAKTWVKKYTAVALLVSMFDMVQPWIVAMVLKGLLTRNASTPFLYLGIFLGVRLIGSALKHQGNKSREWILGLVFMKLDDRITQLLFEKSIGQHLQEGSALSIGNIEKGRNKIWELTFTVIFQVMPMLSVILSAYVALWLLAWVTGLAATVIVIMFLAWLVWLNVHVMIACVPIERDFRELNRYRYERWEKAERVKINNQTEQELATMNGMFSAVLQKDRPFWIWFGKQVAVREACLTILLLSVISFGVFKSQQGIWSASLLIPMFLWSLRLSDGLEQLGHLERQVSWNMPSIRSVIRAISIAPDVDECLDGMVVNEKTPLRIEFSNVSHAFPGQKKQGNETESQDAASVEILRDVNFTIEPGEKVALLGVSGAGKTTIMRLLFRAMDPTGGEVRLNGRDLKKYNLHSFRNVIGYIPQQSQVFDGPIRYNLMYGLKETMLSNEQLEKLLARLKLDDPKRFKDGLETLVGRNGVKLSGGQLQRLMIGAALAKRPKLFVIDEATSHLDSTTEREVQEGLNEVLSEDVSALIVAHRLSTVRTLCSKFIMLRPVSSLEGSLPQIEAVASSFEMLYRISPTFKRMADDQGVIVSRTGDALLSSGVRAMIPSVEMSSS